MRPTASSVAYIRSNGRITREFDGTRRTRPRFSKVRVMLIMCTAAILMVTNPANGTYSWFPPSWWRNVTLKSQGKPTTLWFPSFGWLSSSSSNRITNYGIVALETTTRHRRRNGVVDHAPVIIMTGLMHSTVLCYRNSPNEIISTVCNAIAHHLCHGKPPLWDWNDMAYSIGRIVTCFFWILLLLSYCSYGKSWLAFQTKRYKWLDDSIGSIVSGGIHFGTIVRWNWIGYPALCSMERLVRSLIHNKFEICLHMVMTCCILLFGLGGMANYIGTRWFSDARTQIVGIDGVLAACHGYSVALGQSVLLSIFTVRIDNTTYFWFDVGRLLLMGNYGVLATVIAGGMLGHVLGVVHPQLLMEYLDLGR